MISKTVRPNYQKSDDLKQYKFAYQFAKQLNAENFKECFKLSEEDSTKDLDQIFEEMDPETFIQTVIEYADNFVIGDIVRVRSTVAPRRGIVLDATKDYVYVLDTTCTVQKYLRKDVARTLLAIEEVDSTFHEWIEQLKSKFEITCE